MSIPPQIPVLQTEITEVHQKQLPEDKLCNECMELNLLEPGVIQTLRTCNTCGEQYCTHASSHLDPQYCIYCCNDFQLVSTDETIIRPVKDENGNTTSKKSFRIRHLRLGGDHYLFYNRAITSMDDSELELGIEYHRGICNGLLQERDSRRAQHLHRNKGKTAGNEDISLTETDAAHPLIVTSEGAKYVMPTKKVRTVKTKAVAQSADTKLDKILDKLIAKGITPDKLRAFMNK